MDQPDPRHDPVTDETSEEEPSTDDIFPSFLDRLVTSQADPAVTGEEPEPGSRSGTAG